MTTDSSSYVGQPQEGTPAPIDLRDFDDAYDAAKTARADELPDGRYRVRVQSVTLDRTRDGDPMLRWDLVVLTGPHASRRLVKNAVITSASLPLIKGDLETLRLTLDRFSDLPQHLHELIGLELEATKRARGAYTNVYFSRQVQSQAEAPELADNNPF
jgi:hypothetical protein